MARNNRNDRPRRHGFMLFEMLVAVAFLAAASGVALNMHQARLDYDRRAMDRLRQQLAIENLAEQLASTPYSEIPDAASELGIQSGTQIDVDPFEWESKSGLHVIVRIESKSGRLNHHVWRLEPKS